MQVMSKEVNSINEDSNRVIFAAPVNPYIGNDC